MDKLKISVIIIYLLLPQIGLASISCNLEIDKNEYESEETITGILTIENLNYTGSGASILVTYSIKSDKVISEKTTTIYFEKERTKILELKLPEDIQPGDYFFAITVNYPGEEHKLQKSFSAKGKSSFISQNLIFILFAGLLAVILVYKKYK